MKLDDDEPGEHDFSSDKQMPNIWALGEEDDDDLKDKKADDKEDKKADKKDKDEEDKTHEVVTSDLEEDLEKPSFLRRLGRRRKTSEEEEVKATSDSDDD
jgi:hypothetical protein